MTHALPLAMKNQKGIALLLLLAWISAVSSTTMLTVYLCNHLSVGIYWTSKLELAPIPEYARVRIL